MPELPEVETTRRGVEPHCRGRSVIRVVVREGRLRWPVPDRLDSLLAGQTIESVGRRAKYLLFHMQAGSLMVHLGMSGSLRLVDYDTPTIPHDHIDIQLAGGRALRYHDPRRFGSFHWIPSGESHPLLEGLGPEPLDEEFDGAFLYRRSRGRKGPIKHFIMDAKVVVGVGNIYANEVLFLAGIRPDRAAGRVSLARYEALAGKIEQVLTTAIAHGGTTLRDFVGGDGRPGYFAQQLYVYGREGEPCKRCKRPLRLLRQGQRSSVYCVTCQR